MTRQKIDAGFSAGIRGQTINFLPGENPDDDYQVETRSFAFSRSCVLMPDGWVAPETLSHIRTQGKVAVNLTIVPPQSDGSGEAAVHFPRWSQNGGALSPYDLCHIDSNKTNLFVHTLGYDGAGILAREKVKQVAKSGSFLPYGEVYAEALEPLLGDFDSVSLQGGSMGGLFAVATAGYLRLESLLSVFALDSPGDHYMRPLEWIIAFNALEGRRLPAYNKFDPAKTRQSWLERFLVFSDNLRSDPNNQATTMERLWHQGQAARKIVLASDLSAAAENAAAIDIAVMDRSSLTDLPSLMGIVGHLAREYAGTAFAIHNVFGHAHGATRYVSTALPTLLKK